MSDLLRLATQLRSRGADLADILDQRELSESAPGDLFDLARLMLMRRKLEPVIRRLPSADLELLRKSETSPRLQQDLLADRDGALDATKDLALELEPASRGKRVASAASWDQNQSPAAAALAAYETMLAITEMIFATERHWLKAMKTGLRAPDAKMVAGHLQLDVAQIGQRFQLAIAAGLIIEAEGRWRFTLAAENWLILGPAERWKILSLAVLDTPNDLELVAGKLLEVQVLEQFPLIDFKSLLLPIHSDSLSLTEFGLVTPRLVDALSGRIDDAAADLAEKLPASPRKLIVQGDLSITSPGPIDINLHRELDYFADAEDLGLAARFRMNLLSVTHALECGRTIAEITDLLSTASGRTLPQPVDYLLNEAASRFGKLRVLSGDAGSIVESEDAITLTQIANESAITALGLQPIGSNQLMSRISPEIVYFNLREAGYPAVRVDALGNIISPRQAASQPLEPVAAMGLSALIVERLLKSPEGKPGTEDLLRQLQFGLKHKLPVTLGVTLPGAVEAEIKLELLGVTDARIRGRDLVAEAERTLPLSSIRWVQLS